MGLVDEHLSEWLQGVSLDSSGQDAAARIGVVKSIAGEVAPITGVGLVGYAYGRPDEADLAFTHVRERAQAVQEGWAGTAGSLLTRRLAAAAVVEILENQAGRAASACALAVAAANFIAPDPPLSVLPQLAASTLARLADGVRAAPLPDVDKIRVHVDAEFKTLPPQDDAAVSNQQLRSYLQEARTAVRALTDETDRRLDALARLWQRTSEETDLLWWVLEPSTDLTDGHWADTGLAAISTTGLEIANRLTFLPPPRGCDGFVKRALTHAGLEVDRRVTLAASVAAAPRAVVTNPISEGRVLWSRPFLSGLRARHAAGDSDWTVSFRAETGVDADLDASASDLALQLVRDVSLDRLVRA